MLFVGASFEIADCCIAAQPDLLAVLAAAVRFVQARVATTLTICCTRCVNPWTANLVRAVVPLAFTSTDLNVCVVSLPIGAAAPDGKSAPVHQSMDGKGGSGGRPPEAWTACFCCGGSQQEAELDLDSRRRAADKASKRYLHAAAADIAVARTTCCSHA
jgi:hypothetical protein